jgi:hypothetical protein
VTVNAYGLGPFCPGDVELQLVIATAALACEIGVREQIASEAQRYLDACALFESLNCDPHRDARARAAAERQRERLWPPLARVPMRRLPADPEGF